MRAGGSARVLRGGRRSPRRTACVVASLAGWIVGGCDGRTVADRGVEARSEATAERAGAIQQEVSIGGVGGGQGAITLSQEVSTTSMTVAERLRVTLRLDFEPVGEAGTATSAPPLPSPPPLPPVWPADMAEIEGLRAIDVDDRGPLVGADGRTRFVRTVIYEPFMPGERVIPPIRVEVGAGEDEGARALALAPVRLEVRALVENAPDDAAELAAAIGGGVSLAPTPAGAPIGPWVWVRLSVGSAMLVVPLAVLGLAAMRAKRTPAALAPLPALEEALKSMGEDRDADALPPATVLEMLHARVVAVLVEELGPGAQSLTVAEISKAVVCGASPEDWTAEARESAAMAAACFETARFHPGVADRATAWIAGIRSLRGFVRQMRHVREGRIAAARSARARPNRTGRAAA